MEIKEENNRKSRQTRERENERERIIKGRTDKGKEKGKEKKLG